MSPNRHSWDWFCRLLEPGLENYEIEPSGTGTVDFSCQGSCWQLPAVLAAPAAPATPAAPAAPASPAVPAAPAAHAAPATAEMSSKMARPTFKMARSTFKMGFEMAISKVISKVNFAKHEEKCTFHLLHDF